MSKDNFSNSDYYIDATKINRIEIGLNAWKLNRGVGTLHYPARFGKTLAGIIALRKVFQHNPNSSVIIGTKNAISKDQWTKQINFEFPNKNITIVTYNQMLDYKLKTKEHFDIFIADEIHNLFSDKLKNIFNGFYFTYKFILGLTATPPDNRQLSIVCPIIDYISVEEAIEYNWITNYTEYNVALQLPDADKERYAEFSRIMRETLSGDSDSLFKGMCYRIPGITTRYLFKDDYDVVLSCYSGKRTIDTFGKPLYISSSDCRQKVAAAMGWDVNLDLSNKHNQERDYYWNPSAIEDRVRAYIDIQNKRNDIINNNIVKFNAVLYINKMFNLPCICFNHNISFAESIANGIENSFCYHSKLAKVNLIDYTTGKYIVNKSNGELKSFGLKKIRDYLIENFKAGYIRFISTVEALDESLDVQNIELVICTTGSINPIQYKQRISRANTIDVNNKNKEAIIINLYFDDFTINNKIVKSRDKAKLIVRQKDSYNVQWLTLEQLLC